ncbi:NmrA family NAD(P)-binding protein [Microdochium nivale]|nr:NmrA family NAD(P)-binding protein [Microdochium nivale]
MSHVKNIAIVGANGTIGTFLTAALLATGKHTITALTRSASGEFPPGVTVATIDYDKPSTITAALANQDVLIITMRSRVPAEQQLALIDAAAAAGVRYVMPNDWGFDYAREDMYRDVFHHSYSREAKDRVEQLGVSSWISLVCGFWYEMSLGQGTPTFGIDWEARRAVLLDGGETRMNTCSWPYVGKAVAALLSLPETREQSGGPAAQEQGATTLDQFKNDYVRVSQFSVTQREMLDSVQRVTGTIDAEWSITHEAARERYAHAEAEVKAGRGSQDHYMTAMYSRVWFPDGSAVYEDKGLHDELLGLDREEEELDVATKRAVGKGLWAY